MEPRTPATIHPVRALTSIATASCGIGERALRGWRASIAPAVSPVSALKGAETVRTPRAPFLGISCLPSCDWFSRWVNPASPLAIGSHAGYILPPLLRLVLRVHVSTESASKWHAPKARRLYMKASM
eukprot:9062396-Pyramimonas_sp.AAC.2